MDILLLQTDINWGEPEVNRSEAERIITSAPDADLVVLPEMFTTGFDVDPREHAEKPDGETLGWMRELAAKKNAAVAGSFAVEEAGKYYNRFYFVKPDGSHAQYDKRHLFGPGGESEFFTAGKERVIVEWRGVRILLQTCYDLRFPVFSRNAGDYDLILYVASWPQSRVGAWDVLLRARAIENQCYVAGVNRTGLDPFAEYNGHTALIDYYGRVVGCAEESSVDAIIGRLDMESLAQFRVKFPVNKDADHFELKL